MLWLLLPAFMVALVGAVAAPSASAAVAKPHFFARPTAEPTLAVIGEGLSWSETDPTNTYLLRRQIPGRPAEYAIVKATSALPPLIAGQTVGYSVRPMLGSHWSQEVSITYPLNTATDVANSLNGMVELREGRFYEKTSAQPTLTVDGETLSWEAIDPTNSYELRRKVPGQAAEYALVKTDAALPRAIAGAVVGYSVKAALGGSWSPEVTIAYASPEQEEPEAPSCSLYASVEGSDENPGSLSAPLRTVKTLVRRLKAGQTGCLMSGQTFSASFTLYEGDSHGIQGSPVTITSTDPAKPATIFGRVVTETGADWLTFTHLKLHWKEEAGVGLPQITVGSDHTSWTYDDVENANTTICFNTIDSEAWGVAHFTLIDHDRIHSCGGPYPYTSPQSGGYTSHGVYAIGLHTTVTNNYIYHDSGRGVQLRGSHYAVVDHNIIDENGAGVVFGDLGAGGNEVAYNIITNSTKSINGCCNVYGVYSWWGETAVGTGNTFHHNCLYANQGGNINTGGGGFTASENTIADPLYLEPAARDYTLQPESPCRGYGPDSAQP